MSIPLSKRYLLFIIMIIFTSCSFFRGVNNRQFTYYKNDKLRKVVFKLPKGKFDESFKVGENDAKEQFYYINDGSVFYIGYRLNWQTVNTYRIKALDARQQKTSAFSGKDSNGLYWKEIQFDEFTIGYAYVTTNRLDRFNEALNSVKVR